MGLKIEAAKPLVVPSMSQDMHNELFAQLKRLNNPELKGEEMKAEIERSRAVSGLCNTMISNAQMVFNANFRAANSIGAVSIPTMISGVEDMEDDE